MTAESEVKPPVWRRAARALASLPKELRWTLVFAAIVHGVGLSWGMPGSDAWDNDGIAPRDILPGLAETFTPGHYYTYPPLQLAILAVLTFPVTITAVLKSPSTALPDVIRTILAPTYMTPFTMTARIVCLIQSLAVTVWLALIAKELAGEDEARGKRVAALTALFATVSAPFTYYAHTSNLDVPYLSWATLGVLFLVRAVARKDPRLLRKMALFAAMGAATKDQAYALFLFSAPAIVLGWLVFDPWARANVKRVVREGAIAVGVGGAALAVLDGAVFNPTGFRARLKFLAGPASQDFATYSKDLQGRIDNVVDIGKELVHHYPPASMIFVLVGLVACVMVARRRDRGAVVAALVPLAVLISFTIGFNLTARRVEERFTLPHALMVAVYAGWGFELAVSMRHVALKWVARAAVLWVIARATWDAARVDLTMLYEPRYDAEAWLAEHAKGSTIETYGLNVYLLRFPESASVERIGPTPPDKRNPMPGVTELQEPLADIKTRSPRFVVVSACYAWRYLKRDMSAKGGRIYPTTQHEDAGDADATMLFNGLFEQRIGWHAAHLSEIQEKYAGFEPFKIHGSLNCPIFIFERNIP